MAVSQATIGLARGEIQSALIQDKSYKSNVTNRPLKDLFKKKNMQKTQKKVMSELTLARDTRCGKSETCFNQSEAL